MIIFAIVLFALFLNKAGLNLTQTLLVFAGLFYGGILFIKLPYYYQSGVYFFSVLWSLIFILSALTTWLAFFCTLDNVMTAHRYLLASSLALALVSVVFIGQTLYEQFIYIPTEDHVKLALRLPLILLGSLIIAGFRPQIEPVENKVTI